MSTAVEKTVACARVMSRTRVRSPVGASFLGEVYSGFFFTCKTKCQEALGPQGSRISPGRHHDLLTFALLE